MKKSVVTLVLLSCLAIFPVQADFYAEMSLEGGGDDIIGTTSGETISAGGGLKFALGIQNPINDAGSASIRLVLGYLFDSIDAANGDAEIDTLTFDAMYIIHSAAHSFGLGATMHLSPEYSDNIAGFAPLKIEFDDAFGVVFQYGYHFIPGLEIGVRLSDLDYEAGNARIDAGSFGFYISNGF